jgi:V/A-type H+-transporting ATPase subunit I
MLALSLIGPNEEMEAAARRMVLLGGFQPMPLDWVLKDRSLRSRVQTQAENPYDDLIRRLSVLWTTAREELPCPVPQPIERSFDLAEARRDVERHTRKISIWKDRGERIADRLDRLRAARVLAEALEHQGRTCADMSSSEFLSPFFGRISEENLERLTETAEETPMLVFPLCRASDGEMWALVLSVSSWRENAIKALDSAYFKTFDLAEIASIAQGPEAVARLDRRIANLEKAGDGLAKAAQSLLNTDRRGFENLYSRLYTLQRVYELCKGRGEVSGLYVLSGWIPSDTLEEVRGIVAEEAPRSTLMVDPDSRPLAGRGAPTLLRNLPFVRAFQEIVGMYSLPAYGEIDPSFLVALTFCLFFGFMFGDVGHGAALFLGAAWLQRRKVLTRSLGIVMKSAGVSSVLFGFLYGSVFGVEKLIPALWLSPMEDMNHLLSVAVTTGVIMVSLGLVLNMILRWRERDYGRLLFDGQGLAGLILYWSAAAWAYFALAGKKVPVPESTLGFLLLGLVLVILFRDLLARVVLRENVVAESPALHFFEVLHNLMSFLSNTASFVRLAAFALNHVGLSLAVMMLAHMVRNAPLGGFWAALILVVGNVVIICLEGLIVFIQTLRLEYYEFFSKFFQGGGRAFRPVGWERSREARAIKPGL